MGASTLNRFELGVATSAATDRCKRIVADFEKMDALLVALFTGSHTAPLEQIILDIDATDDPLHGRQEGRFYHGYYRDYCYLPLYITCGNHVSMARLRPSNIDASEGSVEELSRVEAQIRQQWPQVQILNRADGAFVTSSSWTGVRTTTFTTFWGCLAIRGCKPRLLQTWRRY